MKMVSIVQMKGKQSVRFFGSDGKGRPGRLRKRTGESHKKIWWKSVERRNGVMKAQWTSNVDVAGLAEVERRVV